MKKLIAAALVLALLVLPGCGGKEPEGGEQMSAAERTELYSGAITAARSQEENEYLGIVTSKDDQDGEMVLQMLGLEESDMEAFAISVSLMNVRAYGIALIMPAEGKVDTVKEALQGYIDLQKSNFEYYLEDQYEVAKSARLETLEDGTVVMVLCEGQDAVYDSMVESLSAK